MTPEQRQALSDIAALRTIIREDLDPDSPVAAPVIAKAILADQFLLFQKFWVKLFHDPKKLTTAQYSIISMNVQTTKLIEEFVAYVEGYRTRNLV